jgi:predicted porin
MKRFFTVASGAVLSCASAAPVFAQSSVTLYGVLDNGLVYQSSGGNNSSAVRAVPGGLFATRYGFKGSEDIGGGLHVNFQLEQAFSGQTGAATDPTKAFNRLAYVGMSGGFGEVRFGLQNSPQYDVLQAAMDPSWVKSIASPMNNFNGLIIRESNGISYYTPTFGGLNAKFMIALRDPATSGNGIGFYNAVVQYINGPLNVAAGYERGDEPAAGAGGSYALAGGASAGPGAIFTVFNAGASYAIGANRVWLAYHTERLTNSPNYKQHDVYQISDSYQFGPAVLLSLMYGYLHDRTGKGNNAQQLGVLFEYSLSKTTELYTAAGFIQNRSQAKYTLSGTAYSGLAVNPGVDTRGIGVGLVHKF